MEHAESHCAVLCFLLVWRVPTRNTLGAVLYDEKKAMMNAGGVYHIYHWMNETGAEHAERAAASPDGRGIRMGEQNLGNLIADAIRWILGSDISWISGVRIRASIDAGDIQLKDWYNVFANGATICGIKLTGAEVKDYLKQYVASAAEDREAVDFKQVSGIRFSYNSTGEITSVVLEDGAELQDTKEYYVVGEFGLSPENAEVLLDGDSVLVDMMIEFMNSDAYQANRYLEAEDRITKE